MHVRWERVVFCDQVRELVDDDDEILSLELLPEVLERLVPPVDSRDAFVEVVCDLVEELLSLSMFGLLRGEEVNVGAIGTEFFEELRLPDSTSPLNNDEVRTRGLHRVGVGIEFRLPAVEGHTLSNDYCDNDLSVRSTRPNRELLGLRTEYRTKPGERSKRNRAGETGMPAVSSIARFRLVTPRILDRQ